jgi:hypothetical protein
MKTTFRIFIFLLLAVPYVVKAQITSYKVSYAYVNFKSAPQQRWFTLRSYTSGTSHKYLAVNPATLETRTWDENEVNKREEIDLKTFLAQNYTYLYAQLYRKAASNDSSLQDAGFKHDWMQNRGICLTVDLCPSTKSLDRGVFRKIIRHFGSKAKPVPIAICVSGSWIKAHKEDLDWIKSYIKSGDLAITWVNHSLHHYVSKTLPLNKNFLLEPNANVPSEVLGNEQFMLENGLTPSVFFRFPGLVSDKKVFKLVMQYGLIPLGSDAWLAKNQQPKVGSIVLIHGNGNEPLGVKKFYELLDNDRENTTRQSWMLYDLRGM